MHLHLAAILPVCETFNPILKQTIAQPKDWKLHFPALASALGNLGNYDLSWLCSGAERRQAAPAGGWALLSSCHVIPAEMSHLGSVEGHLLLWRGHRNFTASSALRLQQNSGKWVWDGSLQEFPSSSHTALRGLWGGWVDFSPCRMLPKAKLCDGGWYQWEWEIGWGKLDLKIIYCRLKRE